MELDVLVCLKLQVQGWLLKDQSYRPSYRALLLGDVVAVYRSVAGRGFQQGAENIDRRAFSSAVRPQKAEKLTFFDHKRDVIYCYYVSELSDQVVDGDDVLGQISILVGNWSGVVVI